MITAAEKIKLTQDLKDLGNKFARNGVTFLISLNWNDETEDSQGLTFINGSVVDLDRLRETSRQAIESAILRIQRPNAVN